jgi:hypothetical protein
MTPDATPPRVGQPEAGSKSGSAAEVQFSAKIIPLRSVAPSRRGLRDLDDLANEAGNLLDAFHGGLMAPDAFACELQRIGNAAASLAMAGVLCQDAR